MCPIFYYAIKISHNGTDCIRQPQNQYKNNGLASSKKCYSNILQTTEEEVFLNVVAGFIDWCYLFCIKTYFLQHAIHRDNGGCEVAVCIFGSHQKFPAYTSLFASACH